MRYVQLRAFHNVAVHGGFSRAASALNLSQPALSDQVKNLEEAYDVLLFDRRKKQVALTEFGQELLSFTQRLFEVEAQTKEFLRETTALRSGALRIVADSPFHLLNVLAHFRKKYPGIFVSLKGGNSDDVRNALVSYEADIGVLGTLPKENRFDSVQLSSTPIVAFAAAGYPGDLPEKMSLQELCKHPLIFREPGSKTQQILQNHADHTQIKLRPAIEAEGREAVKEIVASGVGIGFVSQAEFGFDRRLRKIEITGLDQQMEEALICLKERQGNRLIRAFMGLAKDMNA